MEERKITEAESIEIITSMISRTKERLEKGYGDILLMWGYLTVAVTALIWVLLVTTNNPAVNWLWFLIGLIGGISSPIMAKRKRMETGAMSYTDRLTSNMWSVVGFTAIASAILCLGFLFIGKDSWSMMIGNQRKFSHCRWQYRTFNRAFHYVLYLGACTTYGDLVYAAFHHGFRGNDDCSRAHT